ncbi:MAG: sugar phosphate isomerase/epimerase [Oscillospiraceae bacterium]|nr:sugar phosphate isomerase/epimerase [Oscillospiraceae bacterium]
MKFSFSTLGCPNWMWHEITSAALDLGYDGIELRGLGEDLYVPQVKIFLPENIAATAAALKKQGLNISCVAADSLFHDASCDVESTFPAYIDMAAALNSKYIRVLCDAWIEPGKNVDLGLAERRLKALAPRAAEKGVSLLVETNGVLSDTKVLKGFIESAAEENVLVLWDINHPVHNFSESVETTWENVGKYVRHIHMKDSKTDNGKLTYKMLGYGDLPIKDVLEVLNENGFDGYLSLEWTKRWNDELEDAGIVFAHYIYQVKKMLGAL